MDALPAMLDVRNPCMMQGLSMCQRYARMTAVQLVMEMKLAAVCELCVCLQ